MNEYTTGQQTIFHEDGSTTSIYVEHEPPFEPMSLASLLLWGTGSLVAMALVTGAPLLLTVWSDRADDKKRLADRQRLNKEVFDNLKPA